MDKLSLFTVANRAECARVSSPERWHHNCLLDCRDCRSADGAVLADMCVPELASVADVHRGPFGKEVVDQVPCLGDVLSQLYSVKNGSES